MFGLFKKMKSMSKRSLGRARNCGFTHQNFQKKISGGFTYVELIVVLGIFSMVTSVAMFDYAKFQSKVDIKNLANDIALRFVEVQRNALAGKWAGTDPTWKPSYGLYFDANTTGSFISFADLDRDKNYSSGEAIETFSITKGNRISAITAYYLNGTAVPIPTNMHITFTRPDSGATLVSSTSLNYSNVSYIEIKLLAPRGGLTSCVKLYTSGRIQINSCT